MLSVNRTCYFLVRRGIASLAAARLNGFVVLGPGLLCSPTENERRLATGKDSCLFSTVGSAVPFLGLGILSFDACCPAADTGALS